MLLALFEGRLTVTSECRSPGSRTHGVTHKMPHRHLSGPSRTSRRCSRDRVGGLSLQGPSSRPRRRHIPRPHSSDTRIRPQPVPGPDAPGRQEADRELTRERSTERGAAAGAVPGASGAELSGRAAPPAAACLLAVLGPAPAARRLRAPLLQQPAGRHPGARGGIGLGSSSSSGCPPADWALPGSGCGGPGREGRRGAPSRARPAL